MHACTQYDTVHPNRFVCGLAMKTRMHCLPLPTHMPAHHRGCMTVLQSTVQCQCGLCGPSVRSEAE